MQKYFQKINFTPLLCQPDLDCFRGDYYFGYDDNDAYLKYYFIQNDLKKQVSLLFSNLAQIAPHQFKFVEIAGRSPVRPHRDYDLPCTINYYFSTGSAHTLWYDCKSTVVAEISQEKRYTVYEYDDVDFRTGFQARDGDCYLLNNQEIHSVTPSNGTRRFIQIQFNKSYEEIYALLQEKQYIGASGETRTPDL